MAKINCTAGCEFARPLRYASGKMSTKCLHPDNDPRTTRDIVLLDQCPKESFCSKDSIVVFQGHPALVLGRTVSGRGVYLKLQGERFMTAPIGDVKPYKGDEDAVTLGLKKEC